MKNERPIRSVISLGAHCAVRYHVDRVLGRSGSDPFEWAVTPLGAVFDVIAHDAEGIGESVSTISDGRSAVDARYGICWHHEFPRDDLGKVIISVENLKNLQSKMHHKWNKMLDNARNGRILFIRYGNKKKDAIAYIGMEDEPIQTSELNSLAFVLEKLCPASDFKIAYVNHPNIWGDIVDDCLLDERIDVHQFEWVPGTDWNGNEAHWNRILEGYDPDKIPV